METCLGTITNPKNRQTNKEKDRFLKRRDRPYNNSVNVWEPRAEAVISATVQHLSPQLGENITHILGAACAEFGRFLMPGGGTPALRPARPYNNSVNVWKLRMETVISISLNSYCCNLKCIYYFQKINK